MLDAAWAACRPRATRPATDTILFGELAPRGANQWGVFSGDETARVPARAVLRDSDYRELRGAAARIRGCPTTAAGSRRLPRAASRAVRGERRLRPPVHAVVSAERRAQSRPDQRILDAPTTPHSRVIGNLDAARSIACSACTGRAGALPDLRHRVRLHHEPAQAQPGPGVARHRCGTSRPAVAADYMNWAEYISWRNPRVRSFAQYPMYDPVRPLAVERLGRLRQRPADLERACRRPPTTPGACPLYLPTTTTRRRAVARGLGVRPPGDVRGARHRDAADGSDRVRPGDRRGPFTTIQTVTLGETSSCYFDVRVTVPSERDRHGSATRTRRPIRCCRRHATAGSSAVPSRSRLGATGAREGSAGMRPPSSRCGVAVSSLALRRAWSAPRRRRLDGAGVDHPGLGVGC